MAFSFSLAAQGAFLSTEVFLVCTFAMFFFSRIRMITNHGELFYFACALNLTMCQSITGVLVGVVSINDWWVIRFRRGRLCWSLQRRVNTLKLCGQIFGPAHWRWVGVGLIYAPWLFPHIREASANIGNLGQVILQLLILSRREEFTCFFQNTRIYLESEVVCHFRRYLSIFHKRYL